MGVKEIKAKRWTCDGCGSEQVVLQDVDSDLPHGYQGGSVRHADNSGGSGCTSWYACQDECVGEAVINAVHRERQG